MTENEANSEAAGGPTARPWRVVVTGATGFIGSAVVRELLRTEPGSSPRPLQIRATSRKPSATPDENSPAPVPAPAATSGGQSAPGSRTALDAAGVPNAPEAPRIDWVRADLADPATLRGLCADADVLLHLASDIGRDEDRCELVNVRGTAALVDEAVRAGVGRIVHLSTAAVYGAGPHSGPGVDEIPPAPVSAASRTRLAAEQPVLAAGGTVLRPGLVLGVGDRWVVPALAELLGRVPARWDGGRGLLSVVAVEDLARLFVRLALAPDGIPGGVQHASHPTPVSNGDLMDTLLTHGAFPDGLPGLAGLPGLTSITSSSDSPGRPRLSDLPDLSWDDCLQRLEATPGRVSERQFALLARDHWYRSDEVWTAAGCDPGPGPLVRLAEAADWYRSHLGARLQTHA